MSQSKCDGKEPAACQIERDALHDPGALQGDVHRGVDFFRHARIRHQHAPWHGDDVVTDVDGVKRA
jgi:hypothetical protein